MYFYFYFFFKFFIFTNYYFYISYIYIWYIYLYFIYTFVKKVVNILHLFLPCKLPEEIYPPFRIWTEWKQYSCNQQQLNLLIFISIFQFTVGRNQFDDRSSSTSMISTDAMEKIVDKLCYQSHRSSTKENYHCLWKKFNEFFIKLDRKPIDLQYRTPYTLDSEPAVTCNGAEWSIGSCTCDLLLQGKNSTHLHGSIGALLFSYMIFHRL